MAKPSHAPLSPRDRALLRLDAARLPGWRSGCIRAHPDEELPNSREAALAEALYVGTVKMLLPLRFRIAHHAGKPLKAIDELVQKILALAAWQLTGMDHIPAAVAVDQAVEQCRRFGRARAAGFVNAVLRNFGRQPGPVLAETRPLPEKLELTFGLPRGLSALLIDEHGPDAAARLAWHANLTPPTLLRLFSGVTADDCRRALGADGDDIELLPHQQSGTLVARRARREHYQLLAELGLAQVQDATASAALEFAELRPGLSVLDRCAGNGTKTLHLRDLVGERGTLHAIEPDPRRCQRLLSICAARKLTNIAVHTASLLRETTIDPATRFDRVLLDVPCSNSGVLARRPEARFHPPPVVGSSAQSLLKLQSDLLADTAGSVAVGGLLIYSTCSVWKSENQDQVRSFLDRDHRFLLRVDRLALPSALDTPADPAKPSSSQTFDPSTYHDGGYIAVLVRDR
jgi:16S rRNA (cytosine967-C5)-methyltransferase